MNGFSYPKDPITYLIDTHGCTAPNGHNPGADYFSDLDSDELVLIRFVKQDGRHTMVPRDLANTNLKCSQFIEIESKAGEVVGNAPFDILFSGEIEGIRLVFVSSKN